MPAGQELQLHRPVVGLLARGQDRLLSLRTQRPRTRAWPRAARPQARQRRALGLARGLPAMPPPMRRGRRNRTLSSSSSERASTLNQTNQLQTARQSELASTVLHVRPPSDGSVVADRTLRRGPDVPQPFTTSVGSSTRAPGAASAA